MTADQTDSSGSGSGSDSDSDSAGLGAIPPAEREDLHPNLGNCAVGAVLAPLAERYMRWLSVDLDQMPADRDEAATEVQAMQLVLRMERATLPLWSEALMVACQAATALCLDERSAPGGEWHDAVASYVDAHIRKVTRRARAGQWDAVADLPGITVTVESTEVRALVPGPVAHLDKRVSRLQVGGTDVEVDLEAGDRDIGSDGRLILQVPEHIPMTTGKLMAQTGHAGMIAAALLARDDPAALDRWVANGFPMELHRLTEEAWIGVHPAAAGESGWERGLVAVRDAGFTEIDPGTITVIADVSAMR